MQKINQFSFYTMGKAFKALDAYKNRKDDIPAGEIVWDLSFAKMEIDNLIQGRPIPLRISRQSAENLRFFISSVIDDHFSDTNEHGQKVARFFAKETDPAIPSWKISNILYYLSTFETVFSEEMRETATYFVPRRGIFDTTALVDTADQSFPDEMRSFIPEKTKEEWKAAGRCLAFAMYSASGFHVARAVEGTLEAYYQLYTNQTEATLKMWGEYIKALKAIPKAANALSPSEKTMSELEQMKDDYRNPLMHPRVILTESDARMLFSNGESLIIAMAQEIKQNMPRRSSAPVLAAVQDGTIEQATL